MRWTRREYTDRVSIRCPCAGVGRLTHTMKRAKKPANTPPPFAGTSARLWLGYWPEQQSAVHTLKLTQVLINPFGLRFKTTKRLDRGTHLHLRILFPPITALALHGLVSYVGPATETGYLVSIRFTTIRDSDRQWLSSFVAHRAAIRLRAQCTSLHKGSSSQPALITQAR